MALPGLTTVANQLGRQTPGERPRDTGGPQGHINSRQLDGDVMRHDVTARYIQMLHDVRLEPYPVLITALWAIEYVYNEVPAVLAPSPSCPRLLPYAHDALPWAASSAKSRKTAIFQAEGLAVSLLRALFTLPTPGSNARGPGNVQWAMPDVNLPVETSGSGMELRWHLPVYVHAPCLLDTIFSSDGLEELSQSCSGWRDALSGQGSPPARWRCVGRGGVLASDHAPRALQGWASLGEVAQQFQEFQQRWGSQAFSDYVAKLERQADCALAAAPQVPPPPPPLLPSNTVQHLLAVLLNVVGLPHVSCLQLQARIVHCQSHARAITGAGRSECRIG